MTCNRKAAFRIAKIVVIILLSVIIADTVPIQNANIITIPDAAYQTVAYMAKKGIIEDSSAWHAAMAKTNGGRNLHTVKDLAMLLNTANKHSSAVSSANTLKKEQMPHQYTANGLTIINVPSFHTTEKSVYLTYIRKLNALVTDIRGPFVLNFSGNVGGSPSAMILGLYSLIPNGQLWTSVARDGKGQQVHLSKNGLRGSAAEYLGTDVKTIIGKKNLHTKVAVVMDNHSASAAEFTIMSLKHNPNVKSFGLPSAGFTSENSGQTFHSPLSDNSWKIITWTTIRTDHWVRCSSVLNAQGTHQFNNTPIMPDVLVAEPNTPASSNKKQPPVNSTVLNEIKKWLAST